MKNITSINWNTKDNPPIWENCLVLFENGHIDFCSRHQMELGVVDWDHPLRKENIKVWGWVFETDLFPENFVPKG